MIFSDIYIAQGRVTTQLRCGGIISDHFIARLLLSRILKIGQHLVKLWARVVCLVFWTQGVVVVRMIAKSRSISPRRFVAAERRETHTYDSGLAMLTLLLTTTRQIHVQCYIQPFLLLLLLGTIHVSFCIDTTRFLQGDRVRRPRSVVTVVEETPQPGPD